jgi:hypothetical protein
MNGDGFDDILYADSEDRWKWRLGNGIDGFGPPVDSGLEGESSRQPWARPVDYDRDGRSDALLSHHYTETDVTRVSLWRSTGTTLEHRMHIDDFWNPETDHGLLTVLRLTPAKTLRTGKAGTWSPRAQASATRESWTRGFDGLEDAIYPASGLTYQLNSGLGFSDIRLRGADPYRSSTPGILGKDLAVRIADFTGDGADDAFVLHPDLSHRSLATFIERSAGYSGQPVRLIGCSAGACPAGLGQNLANALGVKILAPYEGTSLLEGRGSDILR